MKGLTRTVLKRPVTVIMCLLCLAVFDFSSVRNAGQELTPEVNMPILTVTTTYVGAQPGDVDQLVSQKIEATASALEGAKKITSTSSESFPMVVIQYEYEVDLNEVYDDLKKKIDETVPNLPKDADTPVIMELDMDGGTDMTLVVSKNGEANQYGYVNSEILPEFEKLSGVAEVAIAGGSGNYIRTEVLSEEMTQYGLSLGPIANDVVTAEVEQPGGSTSVGREKASVSTRLGFDTEEFSKEIPLTVSGGYIVYLGDVTSIYTTQEKDRSATHYNGEPTAVMSVSKQQGVTAVEVSANVNRMVRSLMTDDPQLDIHIVNDSPEDIRSSLLSIVETITLAMAPSTAVIWLFFEDLKASLIVGSSIPVSILAAFILMGAMDFSLSMPTLAALSMGTGMMVDNSIMVLESCFRMAQTEGKGLTDYYHDALEGTGIVVSSVLGPTLTTCVVFLPLALLGGMVGQTFKPLGSTIAFCMGASLISAITIVPLYYMLYKPQEKEHAPFSRPVVGLQEAYRKVMRMILPKKKTVMGTSVLLLVFSFLLAGQLRSNLISADDQGQIAITIEMAPRLKNEEVDDAIRKVEQAFAGYGEMESHVTSYGGSGVGSDGSVQIMIYLTDDRRIPTKEAVKRFKQKLSMITDCNVSVGENTIAGTSDGDGYELILKSTDYNGLKKVSDRIVAELMERGELTRVHFILENSAPVVEVMVDAIEAKVAGLLPSSMGHNVYEAINGITATTMKVKGGDADVKVEYTPGEFSSADQVRQMILSLDNGSYVALSDMAQLGFWDSPASISREDKQYLVTITGDYTPGVREGADDFLLQEVVKPKLNASVNQGTSSMDETTMKEMTNLLTTVLMAVFLVFVIMAVRFESPRFSFMVMTTIPFSLIGVFGLLFLMGSDISMVVILGFLMLTETVVNSGILHVDTVNQFRWDMELPEALIEAEAVRMRPILMTTMVTVLSMVPMALALGHSGEMLQGLAIVNIDGLAASTVLSLSMLPVYCSIMSGSKKGKIRVRE